MLPNHSQPPFFHQQHHPTEHLQSASQDPAQHAASLLDADPSTLGFDFDDFESSPSKHPSLSSSPVSTQSVLSQYSSIDSSPLSTFDSIPTPTQLCEGPLFPPPPQSGQAVTGPSAPLFAQSGAMQTEAWVPNAHQVTPRSVSHFSHNRESSRSSLGSNGPLSPFSHNFANPQIAVNDSIGDAFPVFHGADDFNNYQLAAKSLPGVTHDNFYTSTPPSYGAADSASYPYVATAPRRRNDRGLMPPSDHATGSSRSQPVSVASSIASDSPATPAGEPEEDKRHNTAAVPAVPKLGRTMTDAFNDELFNPNFTITSSSSGPTSISPTSDVFNQRLQAANNQHLSAVTSSSMSATSRDRSPFRQGSPFAHLPLHELPPSIGSSQARFGSAQQMREQSKALHDAQAMQQHIARSTDTSTPQTISPKDAMLEFHEPDGEANFPLFPQQNTTAGFNADAINKAAAAHGQQQPVFHGLPMDNGALNNFLASSVPGPVPVPQHYPFIPQQRPQSAVPSVTNESPAATRLGSADTATTESAHSGTPHRIDDTRANGGTYTCTYHGCTQRFATPALLQKHKREGHRQAHGLGGVRRPDGTGMTSSLLNTQAGPHRCDRLNPSTGKPCNAVFSRPYDLTRHEGTIHNPNKQKVRCDLCTEDKTFSRADALTRHYKVCHPEIEFPGKQRRRGGHSDN
ncbi:uncharacterized protein THITE_2124226 [Thermothielavioides terrestris NRRL 8126]|uniref:C2H2-type domain-containing protein n=1 Tax=Thermothielavioides terrestris (strain ATCC 38088 / NRRL 8126) TaxID=578455 RepID=G2RIF2_THETT|nr:uncharacterized protein THITE_2124226 [Thermothielavioides terrestris NRRL 8126]AEO71614.1 hypothetical protein THITE_2124226 [Thermothielavioides terrestris NRRL 8126]